LWFYDGASTWYHYSGVSGCSGWLTSSLTDKMNAGLHMIQHLGHANEQYVMKMGIPDVQGLTNTKYFFVYSQGCYAGCFDNDGLSYKGDCIAEKFVNSEHGTFAVIMNARYGYGEWNSTDGCSQRYQREFVDAIYGENLPELGRANADSKHDNIYRIDESVMRWVCYETNLFGDPALAIKTPLVSGKLYVADLLARWNFVSLPFNQTVDKTNFRVKYNGSEYSWQEAVNQSIVLGFIYTWNRTYQNYELTDVFIPGEGYWMYAYNDCELQASGISGLVKDNYITNLLPKWNIMGVPNGEPVEKQNLTILNNGTVYTWQEAVTNNIILGFIYEWNETNQNYGLTDTLQPGKSYWMYAYHNCALLRPMI
jgi:hypothetical protein